MHRASPVDTQPEPVCIRLLDLQAPRGLPKLRGQGVLDCHTAVIKARRPFTLLPYRMERHALLTSTLSESSTPSFLRILRFRRIMSLPASSFQATLASQVMLLLPVMTI